MNYIYYLIDSNSDMGYNNSNNKVNIKDIHYLNNYNFVMIELPYEDILHMKWNN